MAKTQMAQKKPAIFRNVAGLFFMEKKFKYYEYYVNDFNAKIVIFCLESYC